MGAACTSAMNGQFPNLMLICYQAVENELGRRQEWLLTKINEMKKGRSDAMTKAKDYLKDRELMLAFASAKAALMEDQKLGALAPIKEKLANNINALAAERKKEESQLMSLDRLRQQMSANPLEKIKELVVKWVSEFEDMLGNPCSSINFIDEIVHDLQSNPVDLFKKLKDIGELGDFDEGVIDIAFNPQVKALNVARDLVAKKDKDIDAEIREYETQKKSCLDQAKSNVNSKNYINALMMVKTLPIFEGKIRCGSVVKTALTKELKEIDSELEATKTSKPSLDELKKMLSADQGSVMSEVITKWLSKQQQIVADLATSPKEMLSTVASPISMNPVDIVKELNNSGLVPKVDLSSLMSGDALKTASNAAGSMLNKFGF
eukprot:TRINITY_DN1080_c0_g1_i5.p1 TRINITY_DN1080_c0_g1~~TRINITY_DN1080_c0_g1_i5.p1  ORF type:complete len:378 (+),score=156.95 TRINITY_DN1080_c0_g1_i5:194-1327(+)